MISQSCVTPGVHADLQYAEVTDPIAIQNHIEDAELQLMLKQQKQRNAGKGRGQSAEDKKAKKVKRS